MGAPHYAQRSGDPRVIWALGEWVILWAMSLGRKLPGGHLWEVLGTTGVSGQKQDTRSPWTAALKLGAHLYSKMWRSKVSIQFFAGHG